MKKREIERGEKEEENKEGRMEGRKEGRCLLTRAVSQSMTCSECAWHLKIERRSHFLTYATLVTLGKLLTLSSAFLSFN